ncbi:MAG: hypothetical protein K2X47_06255 [Bdellovibrionales bacterium]|nr:hypothetical protein [Bdellovibrionales bacterium]
MRFFSWREQAGVSFLNEDKCGMRIDQSQGLGKWANLSWIAAISVMFLGSSTSWAGFITISPEITAVIDDSARVVRLSGRVTNRGDESAREVSLEFPSLNRRFKIVDVMLVNTPYDVNVEFTFQDLGMEKKGQYTLAYRVLYHDNNMYPFSNVQTMDFILGLVPARSLRMKFDLAGAQTLNVQNDLESELEIESIADQDIVIEKISLLSPIEITAKLDDEIPSLIKPGEKKELDFEVENKTALPGSSYYFAALVSGTRGEFHFSEMLATNILIEKPIEKVRKYVLYGLGALGAIVAAASALASTRKRKA